MTMKNMILLIMVVAGVLGFAVFTPKAIKESSLRTDRSSMSMAMSDYYRRFEAIPLVTDPEFKENYLNRANELYQGLVKIYGAEYVDEYLGLIDVAELKREKSLVRLSDDKRPWAGSKIDPSFLITIEDLKNPPDIIMPPDITKRKIIKVPLIDNVGNEITSILSTTNARTNTVIVGGEGSMTLCELSTGQNPSVTNISNLVDDKSVHYVSYKNREVHAVTPNPSADFSFLNKPR